MLYPFELRGLEAERGSRQLAPKGEAWASCHVRPRFKSSKGDGKNEAVCGYRRTKHPALIAHAARMEADGVGTLFGS